MWFAFVIDDEPTILWSSAQRLVSMERVGLAERARLYGDEREVICMPRARWKRLGSFLSWLATVGPSYARLLEERGRIG